MPLNPSAAMADFVDQRIEALLRTPDGWGPPHAVELQLLLLMEMWLVVRGSAKPVVDGTTERYQRFLARTLPGSPIPLALRLGLVEQSNERFVTILRSFVAAEKARHREQSLLRSVTAPALPARDTKGAGLFVES